MRHFNTHSITNHPSSIKRQRWQTDASITALAEPVFDVDKALGDIAGLAKFTDSDKKRFSGYFTDDIMDGIPHNTPYWEKALVALKQRASYFEQTPAAFKGDLEDLAQIISTLEVSIGALGKRPSAQNQADSGSLPAPRPS